MSHEGDDGITSWIVKAVKKHRCLCAVAGACVIGLGGAVCMKSGTENVTECKQVSEKSEKVVIGAKVITVSNNADVETVNRSTESKFTEGPEIDIEQPSGPQNSKEEKKRKERERRKWLLAALAGTAAGIKIIAMMPTPDPNENNRLPDKIPNIPTPQEKWFKWLWEKREMRFEYRPLEFVRAYAEKYLEGDAKCVKLPYNYVNNYYAYNNKIEDMKLVKYIIFLAAINSAAPGPDVTNTDVKPNPVGDSAASLSDATTKPDAASSDPNQAKIQNDFRSRSNSPESTQVPSDSSKACSDEERVVRSESTAANTRIEALKAELLEKVIYIQNMEEQLLKILPRLEAASYTSEAHIQELNAKIAISVAENTNLKDEITRLSSASAIYATALDTAKVDNLAKEVEITKLTARIAELENKPHHDHNHENGSTTGTTAKCKTCGK